MAKTFLKEIEEHIELHRCPRTGVAFVKNGKHGLIHSAHGSIDITGSVIGMKLRGYWRKKDRTVRTHGAIYNIDSFIVTDKYDAIAGANCRCPSCSIKYIEELRQWKTHTRSSDSMQTPITPPTGK